MFYTYILQSTNQTQKRYVGYTNSLENRLIAHNHPNNSGYTSKYAPWKILYSFQFQTKEEALNKEKWLKSGVGREWVKNNLL